jgi:hypothetical protein
MNGSATIIGRGINHRKLDQDQRAELAADVVTGERPFVPSCAQACDLFQVPRRVLTELLKVRREFAERHPEVAAGSGNGGVSAVVAMLRGFTPAERLEVSRTLGLDWIWDELIAPGIQEDRQIGTR